MLSSGSSLRHLVVGRRFLTCFLRMTWFCLQGLMAPISLPLEMFWISFVAFMVKLLVRRSLEFISRPMWIGILGNH